MKIRFHAPRPGFPRTRKRGFTLIELITAISVMALLLLMVFSMVDSTQKTWAAANSRANQFKEARVAFETMTRRIRQASLNTYWDYHYNASGIPEDYIRQSELHFVSGVMADIAKVQQSTYPAHGIFFQAPLGYTEDEELANFTELMNAWGYFVEFSDQQRGLPPFIQSRVQPKFRFRLMEFRRPSEELEIFEEAEMRRNSRRSDDNNWFSTHLSGPSSSNRVLAENIIAVVISPRLSQADVDDKREAVRIAANYKYDSREGLGETGFAAALSGKNLHLLPPLIRIVMIAIDERSAVRIFTGGQPPNLLPSDVFKNAARLDEDLDSVQTHLNDFKPSVNYRIFNTTIPMRAAKWTHKGR